MLLQQIFTSARIKTELESVDKEELFEELVDLLARDGGRFFPRAAALEAIRTREAKMSTGIKKGIALPHGKVVGIRDMVGAIGISRSGIDYDSLDGEPVYMVFMLLSSPEDSELHLGGLKRLAFLLDDPAFYTEIMDAINPERVFGVLKCFEDRLTLQR
jgi:mannitol/fructose-specific phosphotransferase system IIA component (Ntr-type)